MRTPDDRRAATPRHRHTILRVTFLLALAASACDPQPGTEATAGDPSGLTVRDSAGIEIVENHSPEWSAESSWTIDPEPEIVIGGGESPGGAAGDSAGLVWEVSGLARLADGRIAVLSSANGKLFLFEPSGRLSKSIGRKGEGPGEFRRPEHLQYLPGDTLVVWDEWFRPVSTFDTTGALLRHRRIDLLKVMGRAGRGTNAETRRTPLPDGSFVLHATGDEASAEPGGDDEGSRPLQEYVRVDSSYATLSFGSWVKAHFIFLWSPEPGSPGVHLHNVSPGSMIAVGGHPPSIHISHGEENEIRQFSADGRLARIIRRTTDPVPITGEWRTELERRIESDIAEGLDEGRVRRFYAPIVEAMSEKEFHSPIHALHVDEEGNLWVRDEIPDEGNQWSVFSPEGRWLGSLILPPVATCGGLGRSPCWIGKDLFLGVLWDDMAVERVMGYRIVRPARQPVTRHTPKPENTDESPPE